MNILDRIQNVISKHQKEENKALFEEKRLESIHKSKIQKLWNDLKTVLEPLKSNDNYKLDFNESSTICKIYFKDYLVLEIVPVGVLKQENRKKPNFGQYQNYGYNFYGISDTTRLYMIDEFENEIAKYLGEKEFNESKNSRRK